MTWIVCFFLLLTWAGTELQAQLITSNDAAITTTESGQVQGYVALFLSFSKYTEC